MIKFVNQFTFVSTGNDPYVVIKVRHYHFKSSIGAKKCKGEYETFKCYHST